MQSKFQNIIKVVSITKRNITSAAWKDNKLPLTRQQHCQLRATFSDEVAATIDKLSHKESELISTRIQNEN